MLLPDLFGFAWQVLRANRARSSLIALAMSIGVAAVLAVSALGEGARRYVVRQFGSLGTNLVFVLPGRSETIGGTPGFVLGATTRELTLDDALALTRSVAVRRVAPLIVGDGDLHAGGRRREAPVLGSTAELLELRSMRLALGQFLPEGDPHHAQSVCVIGTKLASELFGARPALGEWLRIGDRRFRVIGLLGHQGEAMGFDTDEMVIVPLAAAQALFNTEALFRVIIEAKSRGQIAAARADAEEILRLRHEGERDVTVITQDAVLATFDRILRALTLAVGGIAAISLAVAGILIMNVMLIAVAQRRHEIGLLKALGATPAHIRRLFVAEALLLALCGAVFGLLAGEGARALAARLYPVIPFAVPWWALLAAPLTAIVTAAVFTALPARRAARLDPARALSRR